MTSIALANDQSTLFDTDRTSFKTDVFTVASYLTDPVCKTHELYRRFMIVDAVHPTAYQVTNFIRKSALLFGAMQYGFLALFLTLPGIALRNLACRFQREPFIHMQGNIQGKTEKPQSISLLSWNVCCIGAGHVITDGGVMPWPFRINAITDKIKRENADVVCLTEVFDIKTALCLYSKMKAQYAHFYFNIGPTPVGVSSGFFVASKYEIKNPSFTAFPKDMLVGRTKNAEKGIFAFDLSNFAHIITLHLQNTDEFDFISVEKQEKRRQEVEARRQEMELVVQKIERVKNRAVIVTGDLNMDDPEYNSSSFAASFEKGEITDQKTWGGDGFCAKLVGRKFSSSLNLDHTMFKKGTAESIRTTLVETGFEGDEFKPEALSDHAGLMSRITLIKTV